VINKNKILDRDLSLRAYTYLRRLLADY
jgi:hypothetical protein